MKWQSQQTKKPGLTSTNDRWGMKLLTDYHVAQFTERQLRVIDKHFRSERNAEFSPNHQHQPI